MLEKFPKLFRRPEILHDMVPYRFDAVPPVKLENWIRMNRMRLDTRTFTVPGFPYLLQLEPTNRCNLACPACPCGRNELDRPPQDMAFEQFRCLIDDMEPYLLFLLLWEWGEPFMNPELPQMIRYAADRGIQAVTSTNCHFLGDEDYVAEILRSGLSTLIVAVDSVSARTYDQYRQGGKVGRVVAGVEKLIALKRKLGSPTRINLRMVVMRQNELEIDSTRDFARSLGVDFFTVKSANPSCGSTYLDPQLVPEDPQLRRYAYQAGTFQRLASDHPCRRVWTMANIQSNGNVVPCCRDYDAKMKLGNFLERPFTEIWNGEAYRRLRQQVSQGKDRIAKCRDCDESFKLSAGGWFPELTEFGSDGRPERRYSVRNRLFQPRMRVLLNQLCRRI